ncbi:MAG: hypothetical protein ACLUG5_04765 [Clostridia bacterium]|jgi:hypothetical protein|nr:MAG TPA: hypothetical protein [Caudoviricetes sp.]
MEIKVGEYVRLARCQGINKIIDIDEDGFLILDDNIADEYGDECCQISPQDADEEILKHSFNIKELIENKDILKVKTKENAILMIGFDENTIDIKYKEIIEEIENREYELLEILTHEQYERECYRLEEK